MEWLGALEGKIVGVDTAPFIYLIEEHPDYLPLVRPFFEAVDLGRLRVVTSVITLLEVLVQPLRQDNQELAQKYRDILLGAAGLSVVPVSVSIAEEAASLRACYHLRTPDAIQIATAKSEGASAFLTNDRRLASLPGIQVLVLDELIRTSGRLRCAPGV